AISARIRQRDVADDPVRLRAPPAQRPTQASGGDHLAPVDLSRLADDVQPLTGRDLCVCHAPPPLLRRAAAIRSRIATTLQYSSDSPAASCSNLSSRASRSSTSRHTSPCASERRAVGSAVSSP